MGEFQRNLDLLFFNFILDFSVQRDVLYRAFETKAFYLQSGQNLICTDSNMEVSLDLILLR